MVWKVTASVILVQLLSVCVHAQHQVSVLPLFQNEKPLRITIRFPFKDITKNTNDSIYFPSILFYKNERDAGDSIRISLRGRGNFRRKHCFFTPLRIRIKKKEATGSLFEGNKSLKLVLPCHATQRFNELITLEYLCYKLYECATPYVFSTRLLDITISDENKDPEKIRQVRGFFIEDDDLAAKRFNGRVTDHVNVRPANFHDTSTVRHDFFQYMIGNTDWSATFHHNAKVIEAQPGKYIPIAYDFDMSGLVSPPYATINAQFEITHLQQRIYRGYCKNPAVMQFVRSAYLQLEPQILAVMNRYEADLHPKTFEDRKRFINVFFQILKDDRSFTENILKKCREK